MSDVCIKTVFAKMFRGGGGGGSLWGGEGVGGGWGGS